MHYLKHHIAPWIFPSTATIAFSLLLTHKSEFPTLLDRYSVNYAIIIILSAMNLTFLWRKQVLGLSYKILTIFVYLRSLLCFVVLIFAANFASHFIFAIAFPRSLSEWAVLALLLGLLIQAKWHFSNPGGIVMALTLLSVSFVLSVALLECLFVFFLVRSYIPRTRVEFVQLMSSLELWPHTYSIEKPSETFRILGLSDSFGTAGGRSSNYHYLLESILKRNVYAKTEMINVSVPGYEPRHQLEILRFAVTYSPDLVLHGLFVGNDFSMLKYDIYVYRDIWIFRNPRASAYDPGDFLSRYWIGNSIKFFREKWRREAEMSLGVVQSRGNFSQERYLKGQFERMKVWGRLSKEDVDRMQEIFPVLDAIRGVVEKNGARYVMVIHPDETQVDEGVRREIVERFGVRDEEYDFDLPSRVLSSYCMDRGIACLDLLPVFRESGKDGGLYLVRDSHYNQAGNELAAVTISHFLQRKGLLGAVGQARRAEAKVRH